MKLNILPARTGVLWVKLGFKTFARQPLAMVGLFLLFMVTLSIAAMVPFIGSVLTLALMPAATLGLMAAAKESTKGKFPMPSILVSALRAGKQRLQAMLLLGSLYALGFLILMGIATLIDGGQLARLYLLGDKMSEEMVMQANFQLAMWVTMVLYLPLSLLFWHAPALVHWHGVSPIKSLFFSFMACYKNWSALAIYGLLWLGILVLVTVLLTLVALVLDNPNFAALALVPMILLVIVVFFTSIYFTFRDSFTDTDLPTSDLSGDFT